MTDFTETLTTLCCTSELDQLIENTARYQPPRGLWGLTQAMACSPNPGHKGRERAAVDGEGEMLEQKLNELKVHALPDQWCMLIVTPGKEQDARDSFHRYGIQAYWPNYLGPTRWSSRPREPRRTDHRSVIPGYLFVPMLPTPTLRDVMERIVGVDNVVRNYSGDLAILRNTDIEVIRQIEAGLKTPKPGKSLRSFKPGEKVRFCDDLLNRWPLGRVASSTKDGRISVEVGVMERIVQFIVFPHQIERY
jgi:transcription antitermination factor NusG